jgi:hypothetical protein
MELQDALELLPQEMLNNMLQHLAEQGYYDAPNIEDDARGRRKC